MLSRECASPEEPKTQACGPDAIPPLRTLYYYLTGSCNLACRHCWLAPGHSCAPDDAQPLDRDLFRVSLEEALPLGLRSVKLTGGEPLLHPQIREILSTVSDHGLGLTVETNGVLCTPELARAIGRVHDAFVAVSIDGADAATHDAVRGVEGAFEGATSAVQMLADADIETQVVMALMRGNVGQVDAVIALAHALGARSVKLNVVQPSGRAVGPAGGMGIAELVALARRVEMETAPHTPLEVIFDGPAAFRPLSRMAARPNRGVCNVLALLGVLADGHYALCGIGTHVPELVFGTVGVDDLASVWRSHPVLAELREGMPGRLGGVCGRCVMRNSCLGSCVAMNYLGSSSLWAPHWFCEQAEAQGLFPESRLATPAVRTQPAAVQAAVA